MSSYSTGTVGPSHRAVMHEGGVIAIAETVTLASVIVRALNDQEKGAEETVKTMQPVKVGDNQLYVHPDCGNSEIQVYPEVQIEDQECSRCFAEHPRWVKVWAEL